MAQVEAANVDLEKLAIEAVELARKAGASDAEAVARSGDEFSVNVRMGEVETLKESGSRALGLRVFLGRRSASSSTSGLEEICIFKRAAASSTRSMALSGRMRSAM